MSRKFDRREKINQEADKLFRAALQSPRFIARFLDMILRPKPWYLPEFAWKKLIRYILK